jgi:hypothetical protein
VKSKSYAVIPGSAIIGPRALGAASRSTPIRLSS